MDKTEDSYLDNLSVEIYSQAFNRDFDDVDKDVSDKLIADANKSDEDEEMAAKFGY